MARVKVNSKRAERSLRLRLDKLTKSKRLLTDIGEIAVRNSVADVRLGKDPETGAALAPFSGRNPDRYVERRKAIAKRFGSGRNFRAKKSNLTLSGQLLNSVKYFIKGKVLTIRASGKRSSLGGGRSVSNEDLASWHSEGAGNLKRRNVIGVSNKTRNIIRARVLSFIRRNIRNL